MCWANSSTDTQPKHSLTLSLQGNPLELLEVEAARVGASTAACKITLGAGAWTCPETAAGGSPGSGSGLFHL